jgi:hypothetical protein
MEIFGELNDDSYDILYEHSYYDALMNKDICPIKYCPITVSLKDLIDKKDLDNDNKPCKILSKRAYIDTWNKIKDNIINKNNFYFKKGILWFRSRVEMIEFYVEMKNIIKDYTLFPTMSVNNNEKNKNLMKLKEKSGLIKKDFDDAINNFVKMNNNALLLSVMRATEGFDDDKLEFGIRMYYSKTIDPLNESQKMGRLNRWFENNINGPKKCGFFGSLEISDNKDDIRKSLLQRFKSWIAFARRYNIKGSDYNKDIVHKEIKEIINKYVDIDTLEYYQIKKAILTENKKRKNNDKINTKSTYNVWALNRNFPKSDELEEFGFTDFKWLFSMDVNDFLTWNQLKKICTEYQNKYPNKKRIELYDFMLSKNEKIPSEPEIFYENNFTNLNDLFSNH